MKNFLKSLNFKNISETAKRFPLSFFYISIIFVIFIYLAYKWNNIDENLISDLLKINFSFINTFFLSLWFYLFSESKNFNRIKTCIFQAIAILFWLAFYFYYTKYFDFYNIIISFWIISFLFFSPYITNIFKEEKNEKNTFTSYLYKTSEIFISSFIVWAVLVILWIIALQSIFYLFELKDFFKEDKLMMYWIIFSCSLFAPVFGLTKFPKWLKNIEFQKNIFFFFLINYIAIPFIFIFFIILYLYSIKVLINFHNWPKWQISWLVIAFSSFGYLIYMFSQFYEKENKFINIFRKYFPYAVIPQIFMLFYAIFLRINQYDITANRYLIVVFGFWLTIISLYLIFSKRKFSAFILFVLTIFCLIISVWPWWIYQLPESRQFARLEKNLEKAWILQNWQIFYLKDYTDISENLSKDIASQISYICNFNDCKKIKEVFSKEYEELKLKIINDNKDLIKNWAKVDKIEREPGKWEIASYIKEKIKVREYIQKEDFKNIYFYDNNIFPINTDWYDNLYVISTYGNYDKSRNWSLKLSWNSIILDENNKVNLAFDLKDELLKRKNDKNISFEFNYEWKNYKLIIENFYIREENWSYILESFNWYFLTLN